MVAPLFRPPSFTRSEAVEVVSSRRIERLTELLRAGRTEAVAEFWEQAARLGTPLVEPDVQGDPGRRAVTFLWRDRPVDGSPAGSVVLHANKFTDYADLGSFALERLPGTDVWHRTFRVRADWRSSYALGPLPHQLSADLRAAGRARRDELMRHAGHDPLNRHPMRDHRNGTTQSVVELDEAPAQLWVDGAPDPARLQRRRMPDGRATWIFTPPGYSAASGPYPVLVLLDGGMWAEQHPIAPTLDALIDDGRIPPMVAVLVAPVASGTRIAELACNPDFVDQLHHTLLPAVGTDVAITSDPARTIIAGQSFGGLAAAYAGWRRPERFGNVLAQSGSFWWTDGAPHEPGAEWFTSRIRETAPLPVRFHLQVGLLEWGLPPIVRQLRDVLAAKGNEVQLREFYAGHDRACWRGGLADGLVELTAGWGKTRAE